MTSPVAKALGDSSLLSPFLRRLAEKESSLFSKILCHVRHRRPTKHAKDDHDGGFARDEKFEQDAELWWRERDGPFGPLHSIDPTRCSFIKDECLEHFKRKKTIGRVVNRYLV